MMNVKLCSFFLFFILFSNCYSVAADNYIFDADLIVKKDKHFVVHYYNHEDYQWVNDVLRKAEEYYDVVADRIGYSRYSNFWTWDDRVKIFVYSDKDKYLEKSGQPAWSKAAAVRDERVFESRAILTFKQEQNFLESILPHEISHLMLRDFIGFDTKIPSWFDEGVAQLQEIGDGEIINNIVRSLIRQGKYITIDELFQVNVKSFEDNNSVFVFYAECFSVVNFLIEKYGSSKFGYLCSNMKSGKSFNESFRTAYISVIKNYKDLEEQWIKHILEN